MTADEVLARAADYIEQHGWTQSPTGVEGEKRCALMAIWEVSGLLRFIEHGMRRSEEMERYPERAIPARAAIAALSQEINAAGRIPAWNDQLGRTSAEVVSTLRNAKRWL